MTATPAFITPTPESLERAGLRLELAESNMRLWRPSGEDERDERTLGEAEDERDRARTAYRATFELLTGLSAETCERRLGL